MYCMYRLHRPHLMVLYCSTAFMLGAPFFTSASSSLMRASNSAASASRSRWLSCAWCCRFRDL